MLTLNIFSLLQILFKKFICSILLRLITVLERWAIRVPIVCLYLLHLLSLGVCLATGQESPESICYIKIVFYLLYAIGFNSSFLVKSLGSVMAVTLRGRTQTVCYLLHPVKANISVESVYFDLSKVRIA